MNEPYERKQSGKMKELSNRRFGRLTAEFPTERRDHKGSVYWSCRCICGNQVEVTEDGLMSGNNLSCGCLKRENQRQIARQLHHVDGTCIEWLEKRKKRRDNTSGFRGVSRRENGKYRVTIGFKGQRFYLGTFAGLEEAVQARLKAEAEIHEAFVKKYRLWSEKAAADPDWGKQNPFVFRVQKEHEFGYRIISSPELAEFGP